MRKDAIVLLIILSITVPSLIATPCLALDEPNTSQPQEGWATMAPMPTARTELGVAVVDGKIYAIGGTTQTQADFPRTNDSGANEMYDPATNTWTTKASMPTPLSGFAIAAYQGKIYCFGELNGVLEIYDPATDTWTNKTSSIVGEAVHANVANDKIYLIGGLHDIQNGNFNRAYDPQTNSLTNKASIQLIDNRLVDSSPPIQDLFSTPYQDTKGFSNSRGASVSLSTGEIFWVSIMKQGTFVYNPANDSWSHRTGPPPSYVRPYAVAATTGEWAPQQLYIFNENGDSTVLNSLVFTYNSTTDQWDECTRIPSSRAWYSVAVVDDQFYVIGGETSRGVIWYDGLWLKVNTSNLTERYTPAGYGTGAPAVSVLSPKNGTTVTENVAFDVSVNRQASQLTYSLDGGNNVTFAGNLTLNQLTGGAHNITVYATDSSGNIGASEIVYFTLAEEAGAFPVVLLGIVVAAVAVGLISVLFYSKKKDGRSKRG